MIFDTIRQAVHQNRRVLAPGIPDEVLRVEYDRNTHDQLMHEADHSLRAFIIERVGREGPWVIQGVSWYRVDKLPAPGWRVINPFRDVRL